MAIDPARLAMLQALVSQPKSWAASSAMAGLWSQGNKRGFPKPWTFRAALEAKGATVEGLFVEVWYQPSKLTGVRPTLSFTLLADCTRAIGVDDNGPASQHLNRVGVGQRYYQKVVAVPHIHFMVPDSLTGYAEPLESMAHDELWKVFLQRSNIIGAPSFELPPGQLEMAI